MLGGHGYFVDNMLLYHEKKDTGICICYVLDVMPTKQPAMQAFTSQGNMYIYTSDLKHGISTSRRGSNQFQNGTPFPPHTIPHTLIHMKNSPFITRSGLRRPKMPCTMGTTAPLDKG